MNVLITAGGTTEKIDNVRCITNVSTGKLGSIIANAFSILPGIDVIYYICSKTAIAPQSGKVKTIYVDSVACLENTIKELFSQINIDIIVHCMAISDYRVKLVTSAALLAKSILSDHDTKECINEQNTESIVMKLLDKSETVINNSGKISSNTFLFIKVYRRDQFLSDLSFWIMLHIKNL